MNNCIFCGSLVERGGSLYENEYFKVIVDRAPILKNHLLLITKLHERAFSHISEKKLNEANNLLLNAKRIFFENFGYSNCLFAEHGTSENTECRTCGIEHAHIHILPTNKDLYVILKDMPTKIRPINTIESLRKFNNYNYLFISNGLEGFIIDYNFPQLFRKMIADVEGLGSYDWAANINNEIAKKTTLELSKYFIELP